MKKFRPRNFREDYSIPTLMDFFKAHKIKFTKSSAATVEAYVIKQIERPTKYRTCGRCFKCIQLESFDHHKKYCNESQRKENIKQFISSDIITKGV